MATIGGALLLAGGDAIVDPTTTSSTIATDASATPKTLGTVQVNGSSGINIAPTTEVTTWYGPTSGGSPLPQSVANTFRGGAYAETVTTGPTTLYRAYGGTANQLGGYWTTTPPTGPLQSVIDSALDQTWGNPATNVVEIEVPAGVTLYQGQAATQGGLVGGGNQVLFSKNVKIDPSWIKK